MDTKTPPLIDIGPLLDDSADAPACATRIHEACLEWGFFVAVGHRLDDEMAAAFDVARRFFSLAQAEKEATPRTNRYVCCVLVHMPTTSRSVPGERFAV